MIEPLVIHRSIWAAAKALKYPTLAFIVVLIYTAFMAFTNAVEKGLLLVCSGPWFVIYTVVFFLAILDWRDERYEVTEDGKFKVHYRKLFRLRTEAEGNVKNIENIRIVHRGAMQNLFPYGDMYVQVGWEKRRFVLRDVPRPSKAREELLKRVDQAKAVTEEQEQSTEILDELLQMLEETE